MKRFDLRTALIMLAAVALGYMICLATPMARADMDKLDKLEVSELIVDRIIVSETIRFTNGPYIHASGANLAIEGWLDVYGQIFAVHNDIVAGGDINAVEGYRVAGFPLITPSWSPTNILVAPDVAGGNGLDVGKLGGYSADDFVLKSELANLCQALYDLDILIKLPIPKVKPVQ